MLLKNKNNAENTTSTMYIAKFGDEDNFTRTYNKLVKSDTIAKVNVAMFHHLVLNNSYPLVVSCCSVTAISLSVPSMCPNMYKCVAI